MRNGADFPVESVLSLSEDTVEIGGIYIYTI